MLKHNGRRMSRNPRKQLGIRLPADVIEKRRATGPRWMTRTAERLGKVRRCVPHLAARAGVA